MDAVQVARSLGKAIQEDERYIALALEQQKNEDDAPLQQMIESFNARRNELNAQMKNPERDAVKIEEMNTQLGKLYDEIFANENMKNFVKARGEMDKLAGLVNQIITGSIQGKDPDTIEYQECGSSCSSCSGCS